jgi:hypothetical protein|eukprot:COSAG06_NODE_2787_length_6285_cov_24.659231_2_plen_89_part_00
MRYLTFDLAIRGRVAAFPFLNVLDHEAGRCLNCPLLRLRACIACARIVLPTNRCVQEAFRAQEKNEFNVARVREPGLFGCEDSTRGQL